MKKLAENNKATFYTDHITESIEKYAANLAVDVKCFIAESKKNGEKDYILVQNNQIIYATKQLEALAVRVNVLSFLNSRAV